MPLSVAILHASVMGSTHPSLGSYYCNQNRNGSPRSEEIPNVVSTKTVSSFKNIRVNGVFVDGVVISIYLSFSCINHRNLQGTIA